MYLDDGPFVCGDQPTTLDATAYAFVAGVLCPAFPNEFHQHALQRANLVAYADRMQRAYWA